MSVLALMCHERVCVLKQKLSSHPTRDVIMPLITNGIGLIAVIKCKNEVSFKDCNQNLKHYNSIYKL